MKRASAYGPASIGNVAAGFDVLGAALAPLDGRPWGDRVELELAERPSFSCEGPFAHQLPDPSKNLALKALEACARRLGRALPPLRVRLHKGLPVGSGLGSSSATVVAAVRALDALLGHPFDEAGLLAAAGEAEGHASGAVHLDNVAPALLGGLRLVDPRGRTHALPFPEELRFVVASPELRLETRVARAVLPVQVPLWTAVDHAQNLAALVHALHADDRALLAGSLRDLLAEPHRSALVKGFHAVKSAALGAGALGSSLSGAGPAIFAVAEAGDAEAVAAAMSAAWAGAGVRCEVRVCALDRRGARAELLEGEAPCA